MKNAGPGQTPQSLQSSANGQTINGAGGAPPVSGGSANKSQTVGGYAGMMASGLDLEKKLHNSKKTKDGEPKPKRVWRRWDTEEVRRSRHPCICILKQVRA
jgi:hypothetical protein